MLQDLFFNSKEYKNIDLDFEKDQITNLYDKEFDYN